MASSSNQSTDPFDAEFIAQCKAYYGNDWAPDPVPTSIFPAGSMEVISSAMALLEEQKQFMGQILAGDDSDEDWVVPLVQMGIDEMVNLTEPPRKKRGGSKFGRSFTDRDHDLACQRLDEMYFNKPCLYNNTKFKTRFRISKKIFAKIYNRLRTHPLFVQKYDAAKKPGIHPKVKITVALRFLAYGSAADSLDETYYIGTQTSFTALFDFCTAMNEEFGGEYLRHPNKNDIRVLLEDSDERGWPGCIGSLDCTTWNWSLYPIAWVGQFTGKEKVASVQMECISGHDGWVWHSFFWLSGGMNDLSVLGYSPLYHEYASGKQPPVNFEVNGNPYNMGYYLCDGIYRKWGSLINAIKDPDGKEEKYFTAKQESTRKDIERVFGRLKVKWHILKRGSRFHNIPAMNQVVNVCIILHNMIIHSKSKGQRDYIPDDEPAFELYAKGSPEYKARLEYCRSTAVGFQLKKDLVQHIWNRRHLDEY